MTYELSLRAFDSGEARDKLRGATEVILNLEAAYAKAIEEAAEKEAFYRLRLAEQFKAHRDNGEAVEGAKVRAHGDTAAEKKEALRAAGELKLAEKRLDDAVDTRRSLWRLVEWAHDRDNRSNSGPAQQSLAGAAWPT